MVISVYRGLLIFETNVEEMIIMNDTYSNLVQTSLHWLIINAKIFQGHKRLKKPK